LTTESSASESSSGRTPEPDYGQICALLDGALHELDSDAPARSQPDDLAGIAPPPHALERKPLPRLPARPVSGRNPPLEHFVRRLATEPLMRAMLAVPLDIRSHFLRHGLDVQRYQDPPHTLAFERADGPLRDRNAAVSANRPEARLHSVLFAPRAVLALELRALIGDGVLRRFAAALHRLRQSVANLFGGWLLPEDFEADDLPREVIEDEEDVPGERPDRRQRERQPRGPVTQRRRDRVISKFQT